MHLFIEDRFRGGVIVIRNRFGKANLPELAGYSENNPSEYLRILRCKQFAWMCYVKTVSIPFFMIGKC